jgi:PAS domain-containing protein
MMIEQRNEVDWVREFPAAVTVCDPDGVILAMNERACATFASEGGAGLVGSNLLDCHPEPARSEVAGLLVSRRLNCYTIEKNGVRKLIYQSPWYVAGTYRGFVEISLPIPAEMPHFLRRSDERP